MFSRQRSGSTLCPSCGKLVGVNDDVCLNCGRRRPGMWGMTSVLRGLGQDAGFVQLVIAGNVFLYLAMLAVDPQHIQMGLSFGFGGPSEASLLRFGASGALPAILLRRWWTVLSAGWLHAGLLHIGFNLYWIRILAPETAELYGPGRMVMLYSAASVGGFAASSLVQSMGLGGLITVGASAPILGLLGAMVAYSRRTGSGAVGRTAWSYAIYMILFGFLMRGVDNAAHVGGFAAGFLAGYALDPRQSETGNHLLGAVVCIVATVAAVVASLVVPVPPLFSP